uniref:Uncharacterized protein n=1 Tax=Kryptolebias marmoratus TaxID=37003 RepID=A0A3Q3A7F5_KRYMA
MMLQAVFRTSWICFLLFSIGASLPHRKGPVQAGSGVGSGSSTGSGYARDSRYGGGSYSRGGAYSRYSHGSSGSSMDAELAKMIAELVGLGPNRPSIQSHWHADHIPLGMIQAAPVYPSSHIIHSSSGYQRVRDSQTDNKYTTDTFNDIPVPGVPQDQPGSGSQWPQKTR